MKNIYKILLALLMVAASATSNKSKAQTNYTGFEFSTRCLTVNLWATDKRAFDSCAQVKFVVNGTTLNGTKAYYNFTTGGTYTVCMKIYNPCTKWDTSVCKSVSVKGCCNWTGMDFYFTNKCRAYTFEGKSSSGCLKYQFYVVNNGSVVTLSPGRLASYTFSANGSYYVKMSVVDTCNKCDTAIYKLIKVDCNSCGLTPDFKWTADCLKVKFMASGNVSGASYYWHFGDGSTGSGLDPSHSYVKTGVYKVCLTMVWKDPNTGDYCKKEVCKEIKLSCGHDCDLKGDFKFTSQGGYAKFEAYSNSGYYYEWSFGDGTYGTGKNATHQYKKPGNYTVCVKIYDKSKKCSVKICKTIEIREACNVRATFAWLAGSNGEVKFAAVSYGGYKYVWDFGDGTTGSGENATHTYSKPGTYKVCLTVYSKSGNCKTTVCKTVVVGDGTSRCNWAAKGAGFGYSITCPKLTLEAKTLDNGSPCIKYVWAITASNSSQTTYFYGRVQNIYFSSNGTYNVCLKLVDSCHKCDTVICKTITVNCAPKKCTWSWAKIYSSINCNAATFAIPLPTWSPGCFRYSWSVNNGTVSDGRYFNYTFKAKGTYTLCVKITDTCNNCDTVVCTSIKIDCLPNHCDWSKAGFSYSINCNKITLEGNSLTGCYVYGFSTGDGHTYYDRIAYYTYPKNGTYTVCMKVMDTCNNCDTTICKTITINCSNCSWTGAGFGYANKCRDYFFEAKNLNNSCVKYSWSVGGVSAGNGRLMNYSFSKTGTYVVCLKMVDTCNKCDTTICQNVKVDCNPCAATAKFTVDSSSTAGVVYLTNASTGASYYVWDFGDSTYSYLKDPGKHAYAGGGYRKICLTVYDSAKTCSTTYCITVLIVKSRSSASVNGVEAVNSISIYPNPASDYFNISTSTGSGSYQVLNLQGQVISTGSLKNETSVSTAGWAEGIYLVKTISNGVQNTTRVVVVRQ